MKYILVLMFLVSCSKGPVPNHTIQAFTLFCKDKGGPDSIIRVNTSSSEFRGECKNGTYLYFNHGDVMFGPAQKEHEHDEIFTDKDIEAMHKKAKELYEGREKE